MARMPSNMSHQFSRVPTAEIPRSSFDRSSTHKTTMDAGYLVPIYCDEALPGDTFNMRATMFGRLATPLHPFMDNLYLNTFWFAVPLRLLWSNFQKFMGEQTNPGDSTDFLIPQVVSPTGTGWPANGIYDHFGLPPGVPGLSVSALPLRAYKRIWNDWFRDQNLQDSVVVPMGDGPDTSTSNIMKKRGKRHDYFTSSLPWPQKGDSVELPLGTRAPVVGIGKTTNKFTQAGLAGYDSSGPVTYAFAQTDQPNAADSTFLMRGTGATGNPDIYTDLTAATAATINQLRQAFQIQKLYERDARGGTRYTEIIRAHFNVTSPDARMQRSEYLGGGQTVINLHTVPQTSESVTDGTPQANLAAYGTTTLTGGGFTHSFTEHCVVIGLASVRADLNYQQGVDRMWSRRTKFDFYWPALAMIGEQAVLNKEIYAQGTADPAWDNAVWGYQERYAEYRYKPSIITGELRSSFAQSLDTWHLAQDFGTPPHLDAAFIEENPPIDRVIAVTSEPQLILDMYFNLRTARPMPVYGVPGLIDHF